MLSIKFVVKSYSIKKTIISQENIWEKIYYHSQLNFFKKYLALAKPNTKEYYQSFIKKKSKKLVKQSKIIAQQAKTG